jgi:4-carboxymuconolactone decarboxylase
VPRLEALPPERLDEEQRAIYDRVVRGPRSDGPPLFRLTNRDGSLTGPFNVLLHAPRPGAAFGQVGEAIRYGTGLTPRVREMAILAVASHRGSGFEQYAHERVGRNIGLTDTELVALRGLGDLELDDPGEAAAYAFCLQTLRERAVSDDIYATASKRLGEKQVVELTMLLAYYEALALMLSVFEVGVPDDRDGANPG